LAYSWHNLEMGRSVAFNGFSDSLSADYNAGTFQIFGELGYKLNVTSRATIEPYANLAYVHLRTDGFTEKGSNGAALSVQSDSMDTTLSTLGFRASTSFELGSIVTTAHSDLGWRHGFGDVIPSSTASFAAGSDMFTTVGNSIGKDTALIEAGLDFAVSKNATLGVAYQGQFGSRLSQNGVNANFSV
ncbi:autotransporter outer membrane beta-barrel domain-containing protein, partial [Ochrobactrum sp. S1502_03]|uniref:autotransporter outer membrane beta-barrel domain-containing protein n=1 Tax=Ochrobactrum sp. S1502_03 TaxID=3108451 RepID=UPI0037C88D0B